MRKNWAILVLMALTMMSCDDDNDNSCTVSTCDGSVANVCKNGVIEPMGCPLGCRDGACISSLDFCIDNARQCSASGVPQFCSGQSWRDLAACPAGTVCKKGECLVSQNACVEGTLQCKSDSEVQKCVNGEWTVQELCLKGYTCTNGTCNKPTSSGSCKTGEKRCVSSLKPQICDATGKWVDQTACSGNTMCRNGACEVGLCWKSYCKDDETCVNSRCVPTWELTTAMGTACDPDTWVDFCTDKDEAVSCAKTTGVYKNACTTGCKVADMTLAMDGEAWMPAFCDTKWSEKCTGFSNEIPYCISEVTSNGKMYYESTYQCFPAFGGGFLGFDYGDAGYYEFCMNQCDDKKEHCSDPKCSVDDSCNKNELQACTNGKIESIDCTEYDMTCYQFSNNDKQYADCFDSMDECKTLNETKVACDYKNSVGVLSHWKCLKPSNQTSAKTYWVKIQTINCETGCNAAKDGCGN